MLKEFDSFSEAEKYIYKFINDEFKNISYYIRVWNYNSWYYYDYGSHTNFFYIRDTRMEE